MDTIATCVRRVAGVVKSQYHAQEIRIFFSAPNPKAPSSEILDLAKDTSKGANFQWVAYRLYFTYKESEGAELDYYIYHTGLQSYGAEKLPDKVFKSDSKWTLQNVNIPVATITPGDVKRSFPKYLKGPNLFIRGDKPDIPVVYRNSHKTDTDEYSIEEFDKFFNSDFYVVLNPKSTELKNPFGKLVGRAIPEKKEPEEPEMEEKKSEYEVYSYVVRSAMKKDKQKPARGFDIVQDVFKHPTKIKTKNSMEPLESYPLRTAAPNAFDPGVIQVLDALQQNRPIDRMPPQALNDAMFVIQHATPRIPQSGGSWIEKIKKVL